ncbi:MAG: YkgJ family cysteine cluster protein [Kordiimonadaceae bacterium]|nr:YkgJ family cysteine cluster protein [Kordiimonadaceae bacterium]
MDTDLLVKDRECGECAACCIELIIEDPDLVKLPGVKCKNLKKNGGCNIYQTRPKTCREWFCMWRFLPLLTDEWRPDKMGILIKREYDNIPPKYQGKIALNFEIIGRKSVVEDMNFIEVLCGYILQGIPCFISYAKPRHELRMVFLNDRLRPLIETRNLPLLKDSLSSALKSCIKNSRHKIFIREGKVITQKK